jgi:DNA polymerase III gamma/tau subunit
MLLKRVQKAEGTALSKDVLSAIAANADGSPRSALQLMGKVAGLPDEEAQLKTASAGFHDDEDEETINLCRALANPKMGWSEVAKIVKGLDRTDPEKVRYAVLGYMDAVLLSGSSNPRAVAALEAFSEPFYNSGKSGITLASLQTVLA